MIKRVPIIALACLVLLGVALPMVIRSYRAHVLRRWKRAAIPEIETFSADTNAVAAELARIAEASQGQPHMKWFSSRLLRFPNGEWAAYANRSIRLDWRFPDIVITKGSDGRWFYTTLHFCPDMIELTMDRQSTSLSTFRKKYLFHEFSGNPEEQLSTTWKQGTDWANNGVDGGEIPAP